MSRLVVNGFDDDLHQRLRVLAAQAGTSVKAIVTAGAVRQAAVVETEMALAARAREANPRVVDADADPGRVQAAANAADYGVP
jgi:plasmid stability protein